MAEASSSASSSKQDAGEAVPKKIKLASEPVDVCCHPHKDILASCDIDGDVYM